MRISVNFGWRSFKPKYWNFWDKKLKFTTSRQFMFSWLWFFVEINKRK